MKRFFSLILVLCLLIPSLVLAEEESPVYAWEDVSAEAEAAGGRFVRLEQTPYEYWMPDTATEVEPYITSSFALYGGYEYDVRGLVPDAEEDCDYISVVYFKLYILSPNLPEGTAFEDFIMNNTLTPGRRCTINGVDGYTATLGPDGRVDFVHYYLPLEDGQYMELTVPCYVEKTKEGKSVEKICFEEDSPFFEMVRILVSSIRPAG